MVCFVIYHLVVFTIIISLYMNFHVCVCSHSNNYAHLALPLQPIGVEGWVEEGQEWPIWKWNYCCSSPCPVTVILNFLAVWFSVEGPLIVLSNDIPLSRTSVVNEVRAALHAVEIYEKAYSKWFQNWFSCGHCSRWSAFLINARYSVGGSRKPVNFIIILTPWETLASTSQTIVHWATLAVVYNTIMVSHHS